MHKIAQDSEKGKEQRQNDEIEFHNTEAKDIPEDNFDWDWIFDKGWLRTKK